MNNSRLNDIYDFFEAVPAQSRDKCVYFNVNIQNKWEVERWWVVWIGNKLIKINQESKVW